MAVIILLINISVSFVAGIYEGVKFKAGAISGGIITLTTSKILLLIAVSLAILIPMIVLTYLLLHWGFNRLYGRYLIKLNETLTELDEPVNVE
jgi:hypothetical protein